MNAASYGWLHAAACLNRDLQRDGVRGFDTGYLISVRT